MDSREHPVRGRSVMTPEEVEAWREHTGDMPPTGEVGVIELVNGTGDVLAARLVVRPDRLAVLARWLQKWQKRAGWGGQLVARKEAR